ncbi:MAG: hypothetical protein PHR06_01165 [Candidatus Cloacimonetes bacterium]|nr:hypothetical protein [Candidatus Cloacimonadota bacterium]
MINKAKRCEMFMKMMDGHVETDFYTWLIDNGFFIAPASTKYHGNYEGGGFDHNYHDTLWMHWFG